MLKFIKLVINFYILNFLFRIEITPEILLSIITFKSYELVAQWKKLITTNYKDVSSNLS